MKASMLTLAMAGSLCFAGCTNESVFDRGLSPKGQTTAEMAYSGQTGEVRHGLYFGQPVDYERIKGEAVIEGDIILNPSDLSTPDQAANGTGRTLRSLRWTNRIVHYTIDPKLPNQQRVLDAMAHWQANTPIRFVPRTTQATYVTFRPGGGCSSNIGRVGGQQFITLSTGCTMGNTIHEIGHAVGLYHEHARADRDRYITVQVANVLAGQAFQLQTYLQQNRDGFDQPGGFDFGSVMLYDSYAFSGNGQPTMLRKDGSVFWSQRRGLSPLDIATVRAMYP